MKGKLIGLGVTLAVVGVLWFALPESQAGEASMAPGMPENFSSKKFGFFATSVIPDADTGDFTFKSGFLLISGGNEGRASFIIFGVEDPGGDDVDNEGNKLVLVLKVNGTSQTFTLNFDLDDGFSSVSDDLNLDDEDEAEVVQVSVQDPSANTFGVPGLRIED